MKGNAHKTANGWTVSYLSGVKDLDSISVIALHPDSSVDDLKDGQEVDFDLSIIATKEWTNMYAKLIVRTPHTISEIRFCTEEYVDLFGQKCHTFRAYRNGEMIYERDYCYDMQTESDYITNYLSQTKI
jgi:hypothetical protein